MAEVAVHESAVPELEQQTREQWFPAAAPATDAIGEPMQLTWLEDAP